MQKGIKCEYTGVDRSYRVSKYEVINPSPEESNHRISKTLADNQQLEISMKYLNDRRKKGDNACNSGKPLSVSGAEPINNGAWMPSQSHSKTGILNPYNYMNNTGEPITSRNQEGSNYDESHVHSVLNQEGKCSFLIPDSIGTLRYIGETSVYSLLYETRTLFIRTMGPTELTNVIKDIQSKIILLVLKILRWSCLLEKWSIFISNILLTMLMTHFL